MPLTYQQLREANIRRLPQYRDAKGRLSHPHPHEDGSNWKLSGWSNAVLGELGEAANWIKKIERGDMELADVRQLLAHEFADIAIYLDILAYRAGIDMAQAIVEKFNLVSDRVGADVKL